MSTGSFIWYELMTPDPAASAAFYGAVVGWRMSSPGPNAAGGEYRMWLCSDGGAAGGVLEITAAMQAGGERPGWFGYLEVPDVDAAVSRITPAGGEVRVAPVTLEGVGRMAMVSDPQGVRFYVMTPAPPPGHDGQGSGVWSPDQPQRVNWNELASPDAGAAKAFYADQFGYSFEHSMPMGEMGDYCFIGHGDQTLGAVMPQQANGQPAGWLFYIGVTSVAAAQAAITGNGGQILAGPMEVPGGSWIVVASDPHGAGFGVVGPKGD